MKKLVKSFSGISIQAVGGKSSEPVVSKMVERTILKDVDSKTSSPVTALPPETKIESSKLNSKILSNTGRRLISNTVIGRNRSHISILFLVIIAFTVVIIDLISEKGYTTNIDGNKTLRFTVAPFVGFSFAYLLFWFNAFYFVYAYYKTSWFSANMIMENKFETLPNEILQMKKKFKFALTASCIHAIFLFVLAILPQLDFNTKWKVFLFFYI